MLDTTIYKFSVQRLDMAVYTSLEFTMGELLCCGCEVAMLQLPGGKKAPPRSYAAASGQKAVTP